MDVLHIALRIVHIVGGVFWVGATLFLVFFMVPTSLALGPQAGPVFNHLGGPLRMTKIIATSGILALLAGAALYLKDSNGLDADWIVSPVGLGFTVGGLLGFAAFVVGFGVGRPTLDRLREIGATVAASGGPPSSEQSAEIGRLQRRLVVSGRTTAVLMVLTVIAMASARYLRF